MPDNNQIMITVKKSDGTTERVSLTEIKKRQAGASTPTVAVPTVAPTPVAPTPAVPVSAPVKPVLAPVVPKVNTVIPSVSEESNRPERSLTSVRDDNKVAQDDDKKVPGKPVLKNEDLKSLLHEEVPDSEHAKTTVASNRTDQVSKIISSLSFKVSPQIDSRLRSVVQLRLKDIRSEPDTLDACGRSIKDGGLGLTETQARELTEKSKPTTYLPKVEKKEVKENIVDKIIFSAGVASAPIEDLIAKKTEQKPAQNIAPMRAASVTPRAMMHDVHSKPMAMGPLDEIQFFNLVDFRRLSSKPVDAAERLKQKFLNLKEESYLLFMKSWDAWHNSPLYQSYISAVDEAIEQRRPLSGVLGERDKISLAEIEALINFEKELAI